MESSVIRSERGASAVETAFILALFLIPLMLGLTDVARLLFNRIALQEAAQQGAFHYAFEETTTSGEVIAQVINSIDSPVLVAADVTTSCTNVTRSGANAAEVTVTVTKDIGLLFPLIPGPINLTRTATAERFYPCP